jgi:amino acid transporter
METAGSKAAAEAGLGEGRLGALAITFFVVSAAGPLVAMAGGIPITMLFGNGGGIPIVFAVLTVLLMLFAVGYTAMARRYRNAGAFYALVQAGLGLRMGGATGMIALLSYNGMQIGLYGLFGVAADALVQSLFGCVLPWWGYSLSALLLIGVLGYRQIDLSVRLLGLLCAGEYLVVLALDIAIISQGGDQGLSLQPFSADMILSGSPMIGLMLGFAAFIGFEATTIYSEEARDPERSIPLATYASLLVIGLFYTVSTWALVMALGTGNVAGILQSAADPTELLFDVAGRYTGAPLVTTMRILFVTSIFAAMLAFHNALARYAFALGRDGILPGFFGRSHPRHRSPHRGSIAQTLLAITAIILFAAAGADPILVVFTLPTALGTLGILLMMVLAAAAVIMFFMRQRDFPAARAFPAVLSFLGLLGITVLAATRFDVLTGAQDGYAVALPYLLVITAAVGAVIARPAARG